MDSALLPVAVHGSAGAEIVAQHSRLVGVAPDSLQHHRRLGRFVQSRPILRVITHCDVLQPGEDAEEPIAIILAPFLINICYTAGWFVEIISRFVLRERIERLGPLLLKLGFGLSLSIALLPSVYWEVYLLLLSMHVIHHTPRA